jgi:hypothetical protein
LEKPDYFEGYVFQDTGWELSCQEYFAVYTHCNPTASYQSSSWRLPEKGTTKYSNQADLKGTAFLIDKNLLEFILLQFIEATFLNLVYIMKMYQQY